MTLVSDAHLTTFRPAKLDDLNGVVEAYNVGIQERITMFETDPRSPEDIAGWITDGQPFTVTQLDARVLGFARAGFYSDRCVYQGVGEHAVYVRPAGRRQGLGRQLLTELCRESARCGLHKLTGRVFTGNAPSRAAHRAAGFEEVGIQRRRQRPPERQSLAERPRVIAYRRAARPTRQVLAHLDEFDTAISPQRVDDRIQRVTDDAVTALYPRASAH
jgi:L-amino acid N-acyltransferase YncA